MTTDVRAAEGRLVFVDAAGGALSAIAAGVARSLGFDDAGATSGAPGPLPKEVTDALAEVGMRVPAVSPLADVDLASATLIAVGDGPPQGASERWPGRLYAPASGAVSADDFALERMSTARMIRDDIERRLEARRTRSA